MGNFIAEMQILIRKNKRLQAENEKLIYLITVMRDYEKDGIPFDDVLKCDIRKALKETE